MIFIKYQKWLYISNPPDFTLSLHTLTFLNNFIFTFLSNYLIIYFKSASQCEARFIIYIPKVYGLAIEPSPDNLLTLDCRYKTGLTAKPKDAL